MDRPAIPAATKRAVLVEAGHRCAIPTCRATTMEIAHIDPWEKTQDHSFENLIALCPNCHTRYDQKKDIDRLAVKMYKQNLGILNHRYGEFERRTFASLAESGERTFMVGAGGDLMLANAIKDGFFVDTQINVMSMGVPLTDGTTKTFATASIYNVTDAGVEFIRRYAAGDDIAS